MATKAELSAIFRNNRVPVRVQIGRHVVRMDVPDGIPLRAEKSWAAWVALKDAALTLPDRIAVIQSDARLTPVGKGAELSRLFADSRLPELATAAVDALGAARASLRADAGKAVMIDKGDIAGAMLRFQWRQELKSWDSSKLASAARWGLPNDAVLAVVEAPELTPLSAEQVERVRQSVMPAELAEERDFIDELARGVSRTAEIVEKIGKEAGMHDVLGRQSARSAEQWRAFAEAVNPPTPEDWLTEEEIEDREEYRQRIRSRIRQDEGREPTPEEVDQRLPGRLGGKAAGAEGDAGKD